MLLPFENINHWPAKAAKIHSIQYTGIEGEFEYDFNPVTLSFYSLKIKLTKLGYKEKVVLAEKGDWNFKLTRRHFQYNFEGIEFEKIK